MYKEKTFLQKKKKLDQKLCQVRGQNLFVLACECKNLKCSNGQRSHLHVQRDYFSFFTHFLCIIKNIMTLKSLTVSAEVPRSIYSNLKEKKLSDRIGLRALVACPPRVVHTSTVGIYIFRRGGDVGCRGFIFKILRRTPQSLRARPGLQSGENSGHIRKPGTRAHTFSDASKNYCAKNHFEMLGSACGRPPARDGLNFWGCDPFGGAHGPI